MNYKVEHNAQECRFEVYIEDLISEINYIKKGDVLVVTHTGVPNELAGQGIAAAMTKHMLEYAREHGLKIKPVCPYTEAYLVRHPEYGDVWAK